MPDSKIPKNGEAAPTLQGKHDGLRSELKSNGLAARVSELITKYTSSRKKSAEEYIIRGEVIVQAEDEIGKKHLLEFYAGIGEDPEGSAIKKMRKIGQKASRFKAVLDLLPDHWTTIYNLALLPDDKFATLIQDGRLTPLVTWKELSSHVIEAKPKPPKKPRPRLTLELDDVPLSKRGKFVKEMTEMCQKFSVPLPKEQRATLDGFVPLFEEE